MNSNGETTTKVVPPYLSWKTFTNFLDSLRQGLPGRIDRSLMGTYSGAGQSALLQALRYLGLIRADGVPTEKLTHLVTSEGPERLKALRETLQGAYPFVFEASDFDLATATANQLEERFRDLGVSGDTIRKCMAFFIAGAKEAEIPMSRFIKPVRHRTNTTRKTRKGRGSSATVSPQNGPDGDDDGDDDEDGPAQLSWAQLLLSKFPSFDPDWPDTVKAKWFDAFEKLMKSGGETTE